MKPSTLALSISNHNMDCAEVVKLMQQAGIAGSVTATQSVVCASGNSPRCVREPGCRIVGLQHADATALWVKVQRHFDLNCAHVSRAGVFSGCIHDYLSASKCKISSSISSNTSSNTLSKVCSRTLS